MAKTLKASFAFAVAAFFISTTSGCFTFRKEESVHEPNRTTVERSTTTSSIPDDEVRTRTTVEKY
jgi:hypothetical protein